MKQISLRSSITAIYHGIKKDGRICVDLEGKKKLFHGKVYELRERKSAGGNRKVVRKHLSTTPGYQARPSDDKSFIANAPVGGKRYRVIGRANFPSKEISTSRYSPTSEGFSISSDKANASPCISKAPAAHDVSNNPSKVYARELQLIAAQRAAGLDPDVRMSFVVGYVGECRSNLYRKMGSTFPSPIKRGRGNFWKLSVIDAYKAGGLNHE